MFHLPLVEVVVSIITAALTAGGLPALVGLMTVESFGIPPIPGEVILLFAGFLVAGGTFTYYGAFLAALLGGVLGSYAGYWVGRDARGWLFPNGRPRRIPLDERHLDRMDRWFGAYGESTVLVSRLVPVLRSYISYPAGAARMSPVRFGVFTAIGAAPFTAAFLYAGYVLRSNWKSVIPWFDLLDDLALLVVAILVVYVVLRWTDIIGPGFPPRTVRPAPEPSASEAPPP